MKNEGVLFDVLTLVFNTKPRQLRKTAASVMNQDKPLWHWVLCDNGSTRRGTRRVLRKLAAHPSITVASWPHNVGIVEGHRLGLELCEAEYVALLDHDDLLTPDALRIVAGHIERGDSPDYLYSDEDKCDERGRRFAPLRKPDFTPALLMDTAYTCHLSVIRRTQLKACGAFTDPGVEGTQDWDMALRLYEAGCKIVHIPETLYSWRATPTSTALSFSAKPGVLVAQSYCLQQHLHRRGLDQSFEVVPNPLFPVADGHWWLRRLADAKEPTVEVLVSDERLADDVANGTDYTNFRVRVATDGAVVLSDGIDLVAVASTSGESVSRAWLREAVGLFELIPDAGLVAATNADDDPVSAHFNSCRRDVAAVSAPWVARRAAIAALGQVNVADDDVAARLRGAGWRAIASPFLTRTTR